MKDKLWDYLVSLFDDEPGTVIEFGDSDDEIIIHHVEVIPSTQFLDLAPDTPNTHYPYENNRGWN
jgi:hypothetical protein